MLIGGRRLKDAGNGLLVCDGVHQPGVPLGLDLRILQLLHMDILSVPKVIMMPCVSCKYPYFELLNVEASHR